MFDTLNSVEPKLSISEVWYFYIPFLSLHLIAGNPIFCSPSLIHRVLLWLPFDNSVCIMCMFGKTVSYFQLVKPKFQFSANDIIWQGVLNTCFLEYFLASFYLAWSGITAVKVSTWRRQCPRNLPSLPSLPSCGSRSDVSKIGVRSS